MTGTSVLVRRNVWTLAQGDSTIDDYAAAVATMKGRHPSDPTSWDYQAAMHGTQASQSLPLYNGCQHRTWFFLPWHRMFLYYFERIVRATVVANGGSEQWALPFWDYEGAGQQPTLPLAFRPKSSTSSLQMTRAVAVNNGQALSTAVTASGTSLACSTFVGTTEFGGGITGVAQFSGQEGQLETQPHDAIHVAVGGKNGAMGNILAAAQDPIFWLHHANIDRLWWLWAGDQHLNPGDPRWAGQNFTFFDEHGQQVSKTPADVLDIEHQLGYTYETAAPSVTATPRQFAVSSQDDFAQAPQTEPVGISASAVTLTGVPASTELSVDEQAASAFLEAHNESRPEHIYLELAEIEGDENPGTIYGVYLNLPDGASPEVAEAHHAATLSFFGIERAMRPARDEPAHAMSMTRDITALLTALAQQNEWDGQHLLVTFRPLDPAPAEPNLAHALPDPLPATDAAVTIGSIRILYR
jgi:tyrosinase